MARKEDDDLKALDAAIARVMAVIENDVPDEKTREKLKKELAIFVEKRRRIAKAVN